MLSKFAMGKKPTPEDIPVLRQGKFFRRVNFHKTLQGYDKGSACHELWGFIPYGGSC